MSTTYNYSLATDFTTSHAIGLRRLVKDINTNGSIGVFVTEVGVNGDTVSLTFLSALTSPQQTALTTTVANHVSGNEIYDSTATLSDIKPVGTNGGTFTGGSWQTRTLNTISGNNVDFWLTLSGNIFSLQPGTYSINGSGPAHNVGSHQIRIYNTTTSTAVLYGSTSVANDSINPSGEYGIVQTTSNISGNITVPSGGNSYSLQHYCDTTYIDNGFGIATGYGGSETYSIINIIKLS